MSEVQCESKPRSKSKSALDASDIAAMNVLTWLRSFGMLFALAAGAWSGFQAAATSDLLGGAIRAALVWGAIAGTVLVGSWVMGAIIWSTPPDAQKAETTSAESAKQ